MDTSTACPLLGQMSTWPLEGTTGMDVGQLMAKRRLWTLTDTVPNADRKRFSSPSNCLIQNV
jgi:hypothetical protein